MTRFLALAIALVPVGGAAQAVGLGPLAKEGVTASSRKGFYLTLINPYPVAATFRLYGLGWADDTPQPGVVIPVDTPSLGARSQRRMLVIATGLGSAQVHRFRVCAERVDPKGKAMIHARVCSKLVARRVG